MEHLLKGRKHQSFSTKVKWFVVTLFFTTSTLMGQNLPSHITISVPKPDGTGNVTMELDKYSVRDPNHCKLYLDQQNHSGLNPSGANPSNFTEIALNNANFPIRTYRGHVVEEPNSTVIAVIWPGNNAMSAFTQEGVRYLWDINEIPISLNFATGQATVTASNPAQYSSINPKSKNWVPTFGTTVPPSPGTGSGPVTNGNSPHGWKLIPQGSGFKKLQIAYDVEPEWFNDTKKAKGDNQRMFAILEAATNALDLQFARDLGIQVRLTGVVLRRSTDLHNSGNDVRTTWRNNGLGDNPGASNVKANSIPVQQIVYTQVGEGNPVAFQSRTPLSGGNFTKVPVRLDENSGLQHEVSHNWGGAHFVYPNDIMSGGGSWFGPTTNQRHVYNREKVSISGGLPVATNASYNWNVHPYATPDMVRGNINQTVTIGVLENDFDSNGDPIRISTFDANTPKGGTVSLNNGQLVYVPASGFQGRDQFNYTISDGTLFNTTWVQVDVNNGGLLMRYDFEAGGNTIPDITPSNLNADAVNFTGTLGSGVDGKAWRFPKLPNADNDNDDNARAFVSFGDVIDPFDGGHTVSTWFRMDPYSINDGQHCHIVSNSSTAIHKLISGYNIFMHGHTKELTFQLSEQLDHSDPDDKGTILEIKGGVVQANTWYHVVLIIDRNSNEMRGYVNGVQVGQSKTLKPNGFIKGKPNGDRYTSGALGICTYKPKKYAPFVGLMDEFRVYGRDLTNAEIQDLFNKPGDLLIDITPPSRPVGLTATTGNGLVSLNWNNNTESDLSSYTIKRSTVSNGPYTTLATGLTTNTYTDNSVSNGTTYYYVVSALDNSGNESSNSAEVQATPQSQGGIGLSFNPIDDAYVRQASPSTNYNRSYLRVRGGTGKIESYLKFTVTGSSTNSNAKLRLYSTENINNVTVHVASSNAWDENTLTWNNKTNYGNGIATINNITANSWNEFDVSSAITGDGTYTFVLTSTVNIAQLDFDSEEGINIPELVLASAPTVSTFSPEDDAYVRSANIHTNYNRTYLRMKGGASPIETYVKFTVTGTNGTISNAKIRLFGKDDIANATVHLADSNVWDENTITWNSKPGYGNGLNTINIINGIWNEFDVSSAITGDGTYTFVITSTVNVSQLDCQSKEDVNGPELVVTSGGSAARYAVGHQDEKEEPNISRSKLFMIYPNPVRNLAHIVYKLEHPSQVELSIFNLAGQKVRELENDSKSIGEHNVLWDLSGINGAKLSSGIYVAKLMVNGQCIGSERLVLE